jgi:hypothetical protein
LIEAPTPSSWVVPMVVSVVVPDTLPAWPVTSELAT